MVLGVGIDIVENGRFLDKSDAFLSRIFSSRELSAAPSAKKEEYYASRFAAKEAFSKALGTGFTSISAKDIEILSEESGKPYIVRCDKISEMIGEARIHLSISHEKAYSIAMVVLDGTR